MSPWPSILGILGTKQGVLRLSPRNIRLSPQLLGEILKIGIPVILYQLLASASIGLTNSAANPYGDYAVAAMGVVTRIITVGNFIVYGFLKGFQPFAGYNYGAKQFDRLKKAIRLCLIWTTVFEIAAAIILVIFAKPIVSLFGTDTEMVKLASTALRLNAILFTTYGFLMVYASLYLAIGKSLVGGLLTLSRQGIFFLPLIYVLPRLFQLSGIIWTQPIADLLTAAVTLIFAIKINRALTAETSAQPQGGEQT